MEPAKKRAKRWEPENWSAVMVQSIAFHLLLFTVTALHGERNPVHGRILVLNDADTKQEKTKRTCIGRAIPRIRSAICDLSLPRAGKKVGGKKTKIKQKKLLGGELNPGLPRDRRRYSPLYYQGWNLLFC